MADYPDELDPFSEKVSDKSILKKITALVKLKESQPLTNTFASTAKKDPSPFMSEIVEQIENRRQYLQDYADAREAFLLEQQANEEEYESALEAEDRASDARYEERQLNKETAELQSSFDRTQRTEQKRFENELKSYFGCWCSFLRNIFFVFFTLNDSSDDISDSEYSELTSDSC